MSPEPQTKTQPHHSSDRQLFNASGVLCEFLASPEEVGDAICLIRGTMPPGSVVPLHSHAEPELLYVLEGSVEVFRSSERSGGWTTAGVGEVVTIPGSVKHALRNSSSLPMTLVLVPKSELYKFFCELAKPFDAKQRPAPPTSLGMTANNSSSSFCLVGPARLNCSPC
jgi:quercetin dioxygenase-like cupin family protein